jgi:hypothetical protein
MEKRARDSEGKIMKWTERRKRKFSKDVFELVNFLPSEALIQCEFLLL